MKKQRIIINGLFLTAFMVLFVSSNLYSAGAGESIYGHISYVDKDAVVIRQDNTEHKAVINLPVVPGDQIVTSDKGRCELQFDNGTVIRLDKDSRLKVTTVLAPSLTSQWKITTLHLMRGEICSLVTNYNREMFQIITPNAAFDFKKRSTAFIRLNDSGDTTVFAKQGKFMVMYGEEVDSLKTEVIRAGNQYTISADHRMHIGEGKQDFDFLAWNEYINRNFKDLHFGISKVPKKIYRYNKAVVYWAEKWSSLFGEWVYDEVFGYVWKPADELFAFSARPFFHADFVRINNELFMVPQQHWGWIPAHLGTWVWMKWGWTWVPGNTFSTGIYPVSIWGSTAMFPESWFFPSLGYWIDSLYGDFELYYLYRDYGIKVWRENYQKKYNTYKNSPGLNKVPKGIRTLIGKMNKAPVKIIRERLGSQPRAAVIGLKKVEPLLKSIKSAAIENTNKSPVSSSIKVTSPKISHSTLVTGESSIEAKQPGKFKMKETDKGAKGGVRSPMSNFRDWNPDTRWAAINGHDIVYSSETNEVVCPNLGLTSKTITPMQRAVLRGSSPMIRSRSSIHSGSSSGSGSTSTTGSTTSVSAKGGGGGGGGGGTGSGRGGSGAQKK